MTGNSAISSFLLFDEQILKLMIAGGIPAAEAYATIKHIKKKHREQVLAEKEKFKKGFTEYLLGKEGAETSLAQDVSEKVWKIIEDSSSYLFCCAHAFAYACDSAYCAWLKAHYPYEFYITMLKLYTEKGDKDKIAAIITEMKRYKGITISPGLWGQDNRDWLTDKEANTISQSLSSIKFISKQAANDLYNLKKQRSFWIGTEYTKTKDKLEDGSSVYLENKCYAKPDCFTNLLRGLQMNTCLDTRQIEILIGIGYFKSFGGNKTLMNIYEEFFNGKNKLTKTIKSFNQRMDIIRQFEKDQNHEILPYADQLKLENENIGLCLSSFINADPRLFFVQDVDSTYGVKVKLYSIQRGTSGIAKIKKSIFALSPFEPNDCIILDKGENKQRFVYKGDQCVTIPNEYDYWITKYHIS